MYYQYIEVHMLAIILYKTIFYGDFGMTFSAEGWMMCATRPGGSVGGAICRRPYELVLPKIFTPTHFRDLGFSEQCQVGSSFYNDVSTVLCS